MTADSPVLPAGRRTAMDVIPAEVTMFQDAFRSLDNKNCGLLPTKTLGTLLKLVGENPSDAEIQVLC